MPEYINGSELVNVPSIENDEIITDFLSVGVTLLGAPQKMGKTFFCLQLSNAIASEENFLGYKVNQGRVVYCAL